MTTTRLFNAYIGVDYSGAEGPADRISGLSVFRAEGDTGPVMVSPVSNQRWSRKLVSERLLEWLSGSQPVIVGIDHAFSFPKASLERHELESWDAFLDYFCRCWRTDQRSVQEAREELAVLGQSSELRLTERWTSSAKSVFVLDGQGQVGKSTHAGIPWLRYLRQKLGNRVHFWPFDGFQVPEGRSVLAEVYPALFSKRYATALTKDARDAFAVCRWLQDRDGIGFLGYYFKPLLSVAELETALLEGWILGVM
jgi:hypothetical protein